MPAIYAALAQDDARNKIIFDDVLSALEAKRSPRADRKDATISSICVIASGDSRGTSSCAGRLKIARQTGTRLLRELEGRGVAQGSDGAGEFSGVRNLTLLAPA